MRFFWLLGGVLLAGCSSSALPPPDNSCAGPCPQSNIKHVVVLIQENHTFDNHFGRYCTAAPGSNPTCNDGPACCEAAPQADPSGAPLGNLDDTAMGTHDPDHSTACETTEMNGGKMDGYATASCGSPLNVMTSDATVIKPYWDLASQNALADRYFQPVIGASSSNDMYFARAAFVFSDNTEAPQGATGVACTLGAGSQIQYPDKTVGDLLTQAGVPWSMYAGGYADQSTATAQGFCAVHPDDCPAKINFYPCTFDPSDVPFEYYASTRDNALTMKDDTAFLGDLDKGTLPAVSFVRSVGYKSEHPGQFSKLSDGVTYVTSIIDAVQSSRYRESTLVLFTYDEGGGYFDHVAPPPDSTVDQKPYGTRVPFLAIGPFARKNFVSHVTMEHSSVVKFIEWNFLGGATGQLQTRDALVNNLGSVLDPAKTGVPVPEN
ncbi:MAG TPA: alkaline phosphatase family protein [Polyangiaceae bacterium]|nr:alkaline phosphatase family protein [Polyangiaceae bacterium]